MALVPRYMAEWNFKRFRHNIQRMYTHTIYVYDTWLYYNTKVASIVFRMIMSLTVYSSQQQLIYYYRNYWTIIALNVFIFQHSPLHYRYLITYLFRLLDYCSFIDYLSLYIKGVKTTNRTATRFNVNNVILITWTFFNMSMTKNTLSDLFVYITRFYK